MIWYRLVLLIFLVIYFPGYAWGEEEEFSFNLKEVEKKALDWGGFGELKWEHMDINQDSSIPLLILSDDPPASIDRLTAGIEFKGSYLLGISSLHWLLKAEGEQDNIGWTDMADVYETYVELKPVTSISASIGKKSYKWGKGYAWNPTGFINRHKDPDDPEESREGYVTAEVDLIKSWSTIFQTIALTGVLLPVTNDINNDFGEENNLNLAAKLYFLIVDTDIDFIFLTGNSRAKSYGIDFAKNLATNFEIHGEFAWYIDYKKFVLNEEGDLVTKQEDSISWLLGIRYLSVNDITSIIEYYHNGIGYSKDEMSRFYRLSQMAEKEYLQTSNQMLLDKARGMRIKGYGSPQPGRNYLYGRFSQKEPFDILYFTPALICLYNLDDNSYSLIPELLYSGFTNWEIRLRFSCLNGGNYTEFGEKQNSNKLELRLRYFF